MRRNITPYVLVAVTLLLLVIAFVAAFFLPFWDYSKTYAPVFPTQPPAAPNSELGELLATVDDAWTRVAGG